MSERRLSRSEIHKLMRATPPPSKRMRTGLSGAKLQLSDHGATRASMKVPANKGKKGSAERAARDAYDACAGDREAWLRKKYPRGVPIARPKNDGGWYKVPKVKAGSIFANPFPVGDGEGKYPLEKSIKLYRRYLAARTADGATTESVIALLPKKTQELARAYQLSKESPKPRGKSTAHLKLHIVGAAFRKELHKLHGKTLLCFCDVENDCHGDVLAEWLENNPE